MNRQFRTGFACLYQEGQQGYSETTPGLLKTQTGDQSSLDCAKEVQTLSAGKQSKSNRKMLAKRSPCFVQSKLKIKRRQRLYSAGFWRSLVRPGALQELLAPSTTQSELSVCNRLSLWYGIRVRGRILLFRTSALRQRWLSPLLSALKSCDSSTLTLSRFTTPQINKFWTGPTSLRPGQRTKLLTAVGLTSLPKRLYAVAAFTESELM